jgi:hypothetical protein
MKLKQTLYLRRVFKDSVRMYFAPITGAIKGVKSEFRRCDREIARRAREEVQLSTSAHS